MIGSEVICSRTLIPASYIQLFAVRVPLRILYEGRGRPIAGFDVPIDRIAYWFGGLIDVLLLASWKSSGSYFPSVFIYWELPLLSVHLAYRFFKWASNPCPVLAKGRGGAM